MVKAFGPACNYIYTFISVHDWNIFDIYAVIPEAADVVANMLYIILRYF